MTRPKAPKSKQRGGSVPPAGGPPAAAPQQAGQQQAAAKKRPAEAGQPVAAAAVELPPEVDELERKRMAVAEELRQVEKQASRSLQNCRC